MRAAIGSTNPIKVAAARSVMRRIFGAGVVIVPVAGGVSAQPWGDVETRRGAIHRAHTALLNATDAELGLGLEGGVRTRAYAGAGPFLESSSLYR